jgi:hypothetical protein
MLRSQNAYRPVNQLLPDNDVAEAAVTHREVVRCRKPAKGSLTLVLKEDGPKAG